MTWSAQGFAVLPLVVLLAACGGGGGGGSPALAPAAPSFSTPNTVPTLQGTTANFAYDSVAERLSAPVPDGSLAGGVQIGPSGQIVAIAITVTGVQGVSFTEAFSGTDLVSDAGLGGAVLSGTKISSTDGSVRSVSLLVPASVNMSYAALGSWSYATSLAATDGVGGNFVIGFQTAGNAIPTSGTASYVGAMGGLYTDRATLWAVGATAQAVADFAARSVAFSTTASVRADANINGAPFVADPGLNLSGTLTYAAATNSLTGTLSSADGMSGATTANFYGPAAQEFGGAYFVSQPVANREMTGAFVLRRP